jgi:Recombinase
MSSRRKRRRERQRRDEAAPPQRPSPRADELRETEKVERLAYSRRQAAEALGVSISTIDRRVVPAIGTVKTPWGQRLIPVLELERFLKENTRAGAGRAAPRPAGRPTVLPTSIVDRIRREYAGGKSLGEIARSLTTDGVPTAHGGRQWWSSTVRSILLRGAHS